MHILKQIFKIIISLSLLVGLAFLIKSDFAKIPDGFVNRFFTPEAVKRENVQNKAMMTTINHYRPDLQLWKNFILHQIPPDKNFLRDSVKYYDAIIGYAPQMAEAYHLLGLGHHFLGENHAALGNQHKAVLLNPNFFWAWYNLGVMEYQEGKFAKAAESFQRALALRPEFVGKVLVSSRIFVEIIRSSETTEVLNAQRVQTGYREAEQLLAASLKRLRGQPAGITEDKITLKIF